MFCAALAVGLSSPVVLAQSLTQRIANHQADEWHKWAAEKNWGAANHECNVMSHAPALPSRIEAERCLATVALESGESPAVAGTSAAGSTAPVIMVYAPASVDEALVHWNKGIDLAPQDLAMYTSRMNVLFVSGRYAQMVPALEDSVARYKGADALSSWLKVDNDLYAAHQVPTALKFAEALDKHYPKSIPVELNLAKFHNELKEPDQALPYLQAAYDAAPTDAVVAWNLGMTYNNLAKLTLADEYFQKAITLDARGEGVPDRNCIYGEFTETKLKDKVKACTLEKASCPFERQTACKIPSPVKRK
jgi:tetratricopeptide (TPR) repeat protein